MYTYSYIYTQAHTYVHRLIYMYTYSYICTQTHTHVHRLIHMGISNENDSVVFVPRWFFIKEAFFVKQKPLEVFKFRLLIWNQRKKLSLLLNLVAVVAVFCWWQDINSLKIHSAPIIANGISCGALSIFDTLNHSCV